MNIARSTSLLFVTGFIAFASGCGSEENDSSGAGKSGQVRERGSTTKKDRGQGSMTVGDDEWTATSAKFRVKDQRLNLAMSRTLFAGDKVTRQSLTLAITGFKGPGEYDTGASGSRFVSVSIDTKKAKEAETDKETTSLATDAISKARHMMLSRAKVVILAASDSEISGTFSWSPPAGSKDPSISNGKFRAIVRAKR